MKKSKGMTAGDAGFEKDHQNLLREVKGILDRGLHTAYKAVDNIKVQTYWQIGERIVREELKHKGRATYGHYLINNLAVDLAIHKCDFRPRCSIFLSNAKCIDYRSTMGTFTINWTFRIWLAQ